MQTKRKRILLAGAGLLTALTLTMVGCTPSHFTPTVNPPAVPAPTDSDAVTTIVGVADIVGTPFANAEVKVVSVATGKELPLEEGTVKSDASGAFKASVSGLKAEDIVRVELRADGKTMAALMTGDGRSTTKKAPAGYAVAAKSFDLKVTPTSTFITQAYSFVLAMLMGNGSNRASSELIAAYDKNFLASLDGYFENDVARATALLHTYGGEPYVTSQVFQEIARNAGVVQLLTNTITVAIQAAAKENPTIVQALKDKTVSPALTIKIEIDGNTIKIGNTVINTDSGTVNAPPPDQKAPILTEAAIEQKIKENEPGTWVNSGNMNPVVTIGTNTVQVSQSAGQAQMTYMKLLLPKEHLTGGSIANLSGAGLTGSVTGNFRNGTARAGALTFENTSESEKRAEGTISMAGFGPIGTYTVQDQEGSFEIEMKYNYDELGVTLVGAHTTSVTAAAVTLTDNKGITILISGDRASSNVKF